MSDEEDADMLNSQENTARAVTHSSSAKLAVSLTPRAPATPPSAKPAVRVARAARHSRLQLPVPASTVDLTKQDELRELNTQRIVSSRVGNRSHRGEDAPLKEGPGRTRAAVAARAAASLESERVAEAERTEADIRELAVPTGTVAAEKAWRIEMSEALKSEDTKGRPDEGGSKSKKSKKSKKNKKSKKSKKSKISKKNKISKKSKRLKSISLKRRNNHIRHAK